MKTLLNIMTTISLIVVFISCSSGDDGDSSTPTIPNPTQSPGNNSGNPTTTPPDSFNLIFPNNSEICQTGTAVANAPQRILINFKWAVSSNADYYELSVVASESDNEVANLRTTSTDQDVEIDKGKLYQWSVKSANDDGEFTSSQWSFYSIGEAVGNFIPYPAYNIQFEFDSLNDLLSIQWEASDEDGDSLSFDIVLYENDIQIFNQTDLTVNTSSNIPVTIGAHYYATITVKDQIAATSKTSATVIYQ